MSQFTGNLTLKQQLVQANNNENSKFRHYWKFYVIGIHQWTIDNPPNLPELWKAFLYFVDIICYYFTYLLHYHWPNVITNVVNALRSNRLYIIMCSYSNTNPSVLFIAANLTLLWATYITLMIIFDWGFFRFSCRWVIGEIISCSKMSSGHIAKVCRY